MFSAHPASGIPRTRTSPGPLRLLWLAALLFGFLYTHVAGADSVAAHVAGSAVTVPQLSSHHAVPGGHDDTPAGGGESGHTHHAEECDSAHPAQTGSDGVPVLQLLPLGGLTPSTGVAGLTRHAPEDARALPPLRSSLGSVVQQV
ncbi:hypothetical protein ACIGFK_14075 [Streptomyces sp. NPDC085524]|uniref:hypothetical protein n=1 Tax=Streptomyces sp. NPDC085524 TaxID=3365728 RepID=UPI0037CFED3B